MKPSSAMKPSSTMKPSFTMKTGPTRLILTAAYAVLSLTPAHAAKPPVQWQIKNPPTKPLKQGAKVNLALTGQIDSGWHLYALEEPTGGPVATVIGLTEGDPADLLRVEETKPKILLDPLFNLQTGFFETTADFTLHLTLAKDAPLGPSALHVLIRYQSCNDRVCLPPHTDTVEVPITITQ
ncbi:protein-disulfide reductase DsbD family protein [Tunturiibacter empetritectus]|uniref:Thiol:disulfide interchange protein DsbD n=1 Tax=Tunturiibacter lichenicola TaxID=2051959 RepID=A0A852VNS5_9BACT|nr:protein-disulfide reductase DsbD domain-containing protein [Edaphobacter lichenicola]NYF92064.1 thiol:disulfide interchange protein DsbD [Edaphobacter lichenicola]